MFLFEKNENKQKEAGVAYFFKKYLTKGTSMEILFMIEFPKFQLN